MGRRFYKILHYTNTQTDKNIHCGNNIFPWDKDVSATLYNLHNLRHASRRYPYLMSPRYCVPNIVRFPVLAVILASAGEKKPKKQKRGNRKPKRKVWARKWLARKDEVSVFRRKLELDMNI